MDQSTFDAKGFVEFDLSVGTICSVGKERLALVPIEVLAELEPGEPLNQATRDWGRIHGERLKKALAKEGEPGVEALADHLGGTAAALGLGLLSVEIVGDALLFRCKSQGNLRSSRGWSALITGFLAGYLAGFSEHSFEVAPLGQDGADLVFLAGNSNAVNRVSEMRIEGMDLLAAIGRISEGSK
jgi:hypothetical protein